MPFVEWFAIWRIQILLIYMFADFRIIVLFCVLRNKRLLTYLLTYLLYNFYVAAATGFTRIDITAIYIYSSKPVRKCS